MVEFVLFVLVGLLACVLWSFVGIVGPTGVHPPVPATRGTHERARDEEAVTIGGTVVFANTVHGFGRLEIRPGRLALRLGVMTGVFLRAAAGTGRVAFHEGRRVEVFCADLGPPPVIWKNTGILLQTRAGPAVLVVAASDRRRLLDRLAAAGFTVVRHDTAMEVGYRALHLR